MKENVGGRGEEARFYSKHSESEATMKVADKMTTDEYGSDVSREVEA